MKWVQRLKLKFDNNDNRIVVVVVVVVAVVNVRVWYVCSLTFGLRYCKAYFSAIWKVLRLHCISSCLKWFTSTLIVFVYYKKTKLAVFKIGS